MDATPCGLVDDYKLFGGKLLTFFLKVCDYIPDWTASSKTVTFRIKTFRYNSIHLG
jgi:hypothetical protein